MKKLFGPTIRLNDVYGLPAIERTTRSIICQIALLVALTTATAFATQVDGSSGRACSEKEAAQAGKEAGQLKDWSSVYRSFRRFGHCDEDTVAEKYSDSVGRLLANDWKHVGALIAIASSDSDFEQFVIRHIDETMSADEAARVITNAQRHCPPGATWLCKSIVDY